MPGRAFGLLDGLTGGVEVVTGRDDGKEQDQDTTERAKKSQRSVAVRRGPPPPQQIGGQQEGQPAEVEKQLHIRGSGDSVQLT